MRLSPSTGVSQLENLLREKLIPWAETGAPLIWLGTPPRSALPLDIREEAKPPLPPIRAKLDIQTARRWKTEHVNSVEVPVLGCIYEGQVDYIVRAAPGEKGRQWTIPIKSGSFFLIPPGTPFLDGSNPPSNVAYGRGLMIHLRRDGIRCHSYTRDKGKVWLHPYIFFPEPNAWLTGERLLHEMRYLRGLPDAVVYHYLSIILQFMMRGIRSGTVSTLITKDPGDTILKSTFAVLSLSSKAIVQLAADYIDRNVKDPNLTAKDVASHVSLSAGHLNRLFYVEKKLTVIQYLHECRLKKAQALLVSSVFNIKLITHLCGFRNQSHFSHWFTRKTGISPTKYRARYQENV